MSRFIIYITDGIRIVTPHDISKWNHIYYDTLETAKHKLALILNGEDTNFSGYTAGVIVETSDEAITGIVYRMDNNNSQ